MKYMWAMNLVTLLMSVAFLALGLRGLITKKIMVFPSSRLLWVIAIAFLPLMLMPVLTYFDYPTLSFNYTTLLFNLGIFGILLVTLRKQMNGYSLFGVTEDSLHEALAEALQKLNLPYEQSLSRIRLTSVPADLTVAIQPALGTAQISVKDARHRTTLQQIATVMSERFAAGAVPAKLTMFLFYLVFGCLLMAFIAYSSLRFGF